MMSVRRQDFLLSRLGIGQLLITSRDPQSTSRTLSGNDRKTKIQFNAIKFNVINDDVDGVDDPYFIEE